MVLQAVFTEGMKRDAESLEKLVEFYKRALLEEVVPFWEGTCDEENGGYFTCYTDKGKYDEDKFIWLQARQTWMFSKLCERKDATEEQQQKWKAIAKCGAEFLKKYGDDETGDGYFSTTKAGKPLVQPFSIFSDCFMCMGYSQYHAISGDAESKSHAERKYQRIEQRKSNPVGKWGKTCPERSFKSMAVPMIDLNMSIELLSAMKYEGEQKQQINDRIKANINDILTVHPNEDNLLRENVAADVNDQDTHEGRSYNPGHSLECCWFLLQACTERGMTAEATKTVELARCAIEKGWDPVHGGLYAFMDLENKPMQQLEFDQKLWWAHLEAILCALRCFIFTKDEYWWDWFCKLHDYTFRVFWDHENGGEMWGYLARDGSVSQRIKGGKWKGCFHVPRALWYAEDLLISIKDQGL
eukprot:TRINITY_DN12087_c0_g1_i1.p1 TRINITY_DN12087_c0_g1~~TRINITY_DN12087_c0_g1_i1.p1  ORF type:complete len:434 (+),score=84.26 TRINITY_DN12087_c0_g1_i1:64-1302(+)